MTLDDDVMADSGGEMDEQYVSTVTGENYESRERRDKEELKVLQEDPARYIADLDNVATAEEVASEISPTDATIHYGPGRGVTTRDVAVEAYAEEHNVEGWQADNVIGSMLHEDEPFSPQDAEEYAEQGWRQHVEESLEESEDVVAVQRDALPEEVADLRDSSLYDTVRDAAETVLPGESDPLYAPADLVG